MGKRPRLVLATANPHKAAELTEILGDTIELVPRPAAVPDVVEDADTLAGNARLKAAAIVAATGEPAIADDTGLEVDALDGRPGVYSARYAGPDQDAGANVTKLLGELAATGADDPVKRLARFRTVVVAQWADGREVVAEGVVEGTIAPAPRGEGGFGYDPIFIPAGGGGRTFAEMSPDEKHAISHRGRAAHQLRRSIAQVSSTSSPRPGGASARP